MKSQTKSLARTLPLWVGSGTVKEKEKLILASCMERIRQIPVDDDVCQQVEEVLTSLFGLNKEDDVSPPDETDDTVLEDKTVPDKAGADDDDLSVISDGSIQQYVKAIMDRIREVLAWKVLDDIDSLVSIVLTVALESAKDQGAFDVDVIMGYISKGFDEIASMPDAPVIGDLDVLLFVIKGSLQKIAAVLNVVQE